MWRSDGTLAGEAVEIWTIKRMEWCHHADYVNVGGKAAEKRRVKGTGGNANSTYTTLCINKHVE